ncbi:MAG TPA: TadE family protein [Dehalococcoidia bacterium]|nr:TadE family protein [Dehalococcoidia bacterium]
MIKRFTKRQLKNGERGQGLVEFALVLPLFLVLLFAIIDFGMGFSAKVSLTNSVREGARIGAVWASEDEIIQRVSDTFATDYCPLGSTVVTNAQGTSGDSVVVTATCTYTLVTPLGAMLGLLSGGSFDDTFTLTSTADMRLE